MKIGKSAINALILGVSVVVLLGGYAAVRGAMNAAMLSSGNPVTITVYPTSSGLAPAATPTPPLIDLKIDYVANPQHYPDTDDLPYDQAAQVVASAAQDIFAVDAQGASIIMMFTAANVTVFNTTSDASTQGNARDTDLVQQLGNLVQMVYYLQIAHATWSATLTTTAAQNITATIDSVTGQVLAMANTVPATNWTCNTKQTASASEASMQAASHFIVTKLMPLTTVTSVESNCSAQSGGGEKVLVTMSDSSVYLVTMSANHVVLGFQYFTSANVVDNSN